MEMFQQPRGIWRQFLVADENSTWLCAGSQRQLQQLYSLDKKAPLLSPMLAFGQPPRRDDARVLAAGDEDLFGHSRREWR
jgi:hypothetical protein